MGFVRKDGLWILGESMSKSSAELKRLDRTRKRDQGFVLKQIWVKPKDWPIIKKYIDKKTRATE